MTTKNENDMSNRLNGAVAADPAAPVRGAGKQVQLRRPELVSARFVVRGITPLVHNNFNNRVLDEMQAKQQGIVVPKSWRVPEAEFFDSLYITPDEKRFYLKPNAFKRAICDASRFLDGVPSTLLGQALHVTDPYVIVHGSMPRFTSPVHRIGKFPNQVPIVQYRGEFNPWCCEFEVRWLGNILTIEQVGYLIMYAGMGGVGDCRPNSKQNKGGTYGQFELIGSGNQPEAKKLLAEMLTPEKESEKWIREHRKIREDALAKAASKLQEMQSQPKAKKGKAAAQ